jgi:hypothetical protein
MMSAVNSLADTRTVVVSYNVYLPISGALTILANISAFLINVLEFAQGLDDVYVLPRPRNNQLGAFVETVIQDLESLKYVSPVLSFIVESLIQHVHDFVEFIRPRLVRRVLLIKGGSYELYVICDISLISVPVGPHGSLLVAKIQISLHTMIYQERIPFLTLTCTVE